MAGRSGRSARWVAWLLAVCVVTLLAPVAALAAPFAAIVMDARTGQVLYEQNANARLHPASLTKMMTLYVAFDAIRRGEIGMDTMVTVSAKAAAEPPSRLGLRAGQRISMRHLIRAAAIKSANDAATAIGEAIAGSEAAFARRMTAAARALGMTGSTFRNAHGLTAPGHLSTARDMTILGRRLIYDFPEHYALFSRTTVDAGIAQIGNTNRRFLDSYRGADGIKTGYTRAAGFNLTASAERGGKRIVATVFGGTSTAQRNAKMAELMDIGFGIAPANVATRRPAPVELPRTPPAAAAGAAVAEAPRATAKTIRLVMAPARSPRPLRRPGAAPAEDLPFALVADADDAVQAAIDTELREALAAPPAASAPAAVPAPRPRPAAAAREDALTDAVTEAVAAATDTAAPPSEAAPAAVEPPAALAAAEPPAPQPAPPARPEIAVAAAAPAEPAAPAVEAVAAAAETPAQPAPPPPAVAAAPAEATQPPAAAVALAGADAVADPAPDEADLTELAIAAEDDPASLPAAAQPLPAPPAAARAPGIVLTARAPDGAAPSPAAPGTGGTVTRISTSGGRHWGVTLGRFPSRGTAERALLQTGLAESATLGAALRKVVARGGGYEANFEGLTRDQADLACRRLAARAVACFTVGP